MSGDVGRPGRRLLQGYQSAAVVNHYSMEKQQQQQKETDITLISGHCAGQSKATC